MNSPTQTPPPEAVRVWRGFRAENMAPTDFFSRLGSVFVPATVEMQVEAGLFAYLPTVPADLPGKPASVPDETAILFWETQDTYQEGFERLAVRTYTLTHAAVYTPESRADFPARFTGELEFDQPYYLVDAAADWMRDGALHVVGGRNTGVAAEDFRSEVIQALEEVQKDETLAGAIVCVSADYLVYWQLGGGQDLSKLTSCCDWSEAFQPQPTSLPAGLWDIWPGLTVTSGDSFNMQFTRRSEHGRE